MNTEQELTVSDMKLIRKLEDSAIELDKGIHSGEIEASKVKKSQMELNKTAEKLIGTNPDPKTYIVYELQALIHWINQDTSSAYELAMSAMQVKGDSNLYTQTGRQLVKNKEAEWTGGDVGLLIFVGLFWIIGVIVTLTDRNRSNAKKARIIGYGSIITVILYIIISLATQHVGYY